MGKGRHERGVKYKLAISVMFTFTIGLWHTLWHGASPLQLVFCYYDIPSVWIETAGRGLAVDLCKSPGCWMDGWMHSAGIRHLANNTIWLYRQVDVQVVEQEVAWWDRAKSAQLQNATRPRPAELDGLHQSLANPSKSACVQFVYVFVCFT